MKIKHDYWFMCSCILLFIMVFLDMLLTNKGLNLGFKEGNGFVILTMKLIGQKTGLIFLTIINSFLIILLYRVTISIKSEPFKKLIYFMVAFTIAIRSYVVGQWTGLIYGYLG